MARSFNQVTLLGNLTRDPELRPIPGGQEVCSFSLALNSSFKGKDGSWQEKTDFIDCTAWGQLGVRVAQYCMKGKQLLVSGRLQTRQWEQDGQKRSKTEVVANDVTFLGNENAGQAAPAQAAPRQGALDTVVEEIGDEPINLDDIPF